MLAIKPTENLTGITVQGDFRDFYELVDSIYNICGIEEDPNTYYYGVKQRLLGISYDIRHAYQGDRELLLVDNGMNKELMKWHDIITPTQSVYYCVNVLFPEAIFIAAAVPQIYVFSHRYYGAVENSEDLPPIPYTNYYRDKANLDVLCANIWQAFGEAIGDEEAEKIIRMLQRSSESYIHYAIHYIDKCNLELLKTPIEKRKDKLRNIAKRIIKKPQAYLKMEKDLKYWAKEYKTNIYELRYPDLEYLEEIQW